MTKNSAIFFIWQSLVVDGYRSFFKKFIELSTDTAVALCSPNIFKELGSQKIAAAPSTESTKCDFFFLKTISFHTQFIVFVGLRRAYSQFFKKVKSRKKVIVCMAEPYSITAFLCYLTAKISVRDNMVFFLYTAQNINKEFNLLISLVEKFLYKNVDAILSIGREQDEVLRSRGYHGRIIRFPLWFDSKRFYRQKQVEKQNSKNISIGFIGSLTEEKGILDFIAVSENLFNRKMFDLRFYVAGAGRLESIVREWSQNSVNIGKCVYLGSLPLENVPEFYRNLDVLVVPSRTTSHWKEQFGRVIIEAAACGVTVVGSNSGAIPEVINKVSRIFKEGDLADMEKCILEAIEEPISAAEMDWVIQEYSDDATSKKFLNHMENILSE